MKRPPAHATLLALVAALVGSAAAEPLTPEQIQFFEAKIRPTLVEKCYECHSAGAKEIKGGLVLDSHAGLVTGGDTGPAIVPGSVDDSPLISAIRYAPDSYQMPPTGKLPERVIADFEKWVAMGAPDPRDEAPQPAVRQAIDIEAGRKFWSFQPPTRHDAPNVKHAGWIEQPIDAFILARLEAAELAPAPRADKRTLIRRAWFDLVGLPPKPDEVERFVRDDSPDAYRKIIDRLLASPHYGERWARQWLDVVRYAEDNTNMGPHNGPYENAYRYRDWVVSAINEDMPYDEFIRRQLATDLLPATGPEDLPALGFVGLAPQEHKEVLMGKGDLETCYALDWEDRVDGIGRGLLGLTLACARCHDHKYDPITTEDYYALAGVFASTRQTTRPIIPQSEVDKTQPARDKVAGLEGQIKELEKKIEGFTAELKELASKKASNLSELQTDEGARQAVTRTANAGIDAAKKTIAETKAQIDQMKRSTPGFDLPLANAVTEETVRVEEITPDTSRIAYYPNQPRDLNVMVRGDIGKLGPLVHRRFLAVLSPDEPKQFTQGSGRLELAAAIADRHNPLTARVLVNRVWMQYFGVGLVDTPSNFGVTGSPPSHPELLDDLAARFMDEGWSIKKLHREIMLSATYQQASAHPDAPRAASIDPDNRLLWRFNRRRLEAEAVRDAILAVSGRLNLALGGPSGDADDPAYDRRTIYAKISRHKLSHFLQIFDFPDPAIHSEQRVLTITPLQQLFILNSGFVHDCGQALAKRIGAMSGPTAAERVRCAYEILFGRLPSEAELRVAHDFLNSPMDQPPPDDRWQRYAQALLGSNELLYVD